MSIFLPPEGESIVLPPMAPGRKSTKKTTSRSPRKSAKGKRAPRKQADKKNGAVGRAPSVISHIKQPEHAKGSYGANSSINLYLNEIAQYPLISVQDEIDLAARIKKGDEEAEVLEDPSPTGVGRAGHYENRCGMSEMEAADEGIPAESHRSPG